MKKRGIFAATILAVTLVASPLLAQGGANSMPTDHSSMGGPVKPEKYGEKMIKHDRTTEEMMGMLKETMIILRDIRHYPDPEQKAKLDSMIKRMDEMMKERKAMMKKWKEKWEKKEKSMKKKDNHMEGY